MGGRGSVWRWPKAIVVEEVVDDGMTDMGTEGMTDVDTTTEEIRGVALVLVAETTVESKVETVAIVEVVDDDHFVYHWRSLMFRVTDINSSIVIYVYNIHMAACTFTVIFE